MDLNEQILVSDTDVVVEPSTRTPLVDNFLNFATEFGFFLHLPRFRQSLSFPEEHSSRLSPGLLNVVELLGHHLDPNRNDKARRRLEQKYLSLALLHIPKILTSSHADRVIHAIQAEILLGMYFYHASSTLTAKYHLNAALAMSFATGAHKIQGNLPLDWSLPGLSETATTERERRITEGEKINGFWTALSLNISLAVALHSPLDELQMLQSQNANIYSPWPMDIEEYATRYLLLETNYIATMEAFLKQPSVAGRDPFAMYVKSSVLLGRAYILTQSMDRENVVSERQTTEFVLLDKLIDTFHSTLIPFDQTDSSSMILTTVFAIHIMTNVVIILLWSHCPSDEYRPHAIRKRVWAADSAARIVIQFKEKCDGLFGFIHPILIPLLLFISRVIVDEVERLAAAERQSPTAGEKETMEKRRKLERGLHGILELMKANERHAPSSLTEIKALVTIYRSGGSLQTTMQ
ncbi:hypothetical protein BDP27DRAFT_962567 [Rhodocollybia butyracea]|uniref:Transcription factor domain-containing protein n=1 Tax=Rhodocollybia butyracea TaxID=206335 RepID=A0A9P5UE53_9AGAR|nr:hypothetical protein BDP27DRAFT_962567 [Rhodocollybia butyracea]